MKNIATKEIEIKKNYNKKKKMALHKYKHKKISQKLKMRNL